MSTINKITGSSGCSFHLCPVSANSIASQLVKNGAHKTGSLSPQGSSTRTYPTYGSSQHLKETVSLALLSGRTCWRPQLPEARKVCGIGFHLPEFILHARSTLKSWFCNFLTSCMRQLKIPTIWRRELIVVIPKPEKP